uniref:ARAD1A07766p n=1 Tax=Blastobotrys adeninivorans TaxID=409370 RepID=A0A060SXW1_BLAAD
MGVRIRVASTLTVLVLIAFAFELIAVLSVPVTRAITLCTYGDYEFGVFGYCNSKTNSCSPVGIGYDVSLDTFSLPSDARRSLARLLVVHVVSAAITLVLLIFALVAHVHGPANSTRYVLFVLVFSILAFLLTLLAFLVDILLFGSHLSWGGWLMLAATVLLLISVVVLFIMRRMISSEKAMKRRHNITSLHDLDAGNDPFAMEYNYRGQGTPALHELKYENSPSETNDSAPLNEQAQSFATTSVRNDSMARQSRHSFVMPDTDESYAMAASRAYRGHVKTQQPSPPAPGTAAGSSTQIPSPAGTGGATAAVPAGSFIEGADEDGPEEYGPNVVPIPKLRPDRGTRKPSGPRPFQMPDPSDYDQDHALQQPQPQPQQPQQQPDEYVPPRSQWNNMPGEASAVGGGERPPVMRMSPAPRQSVQYFAEGPAPQSAEIVDDSVYEAPYDANSYGHYQPPQAAQPAPPAHYQPPVQQYQQPPQQHYQPPQQHYQPPPQQYQQYQDYQHQYPGGSQTSLPYSTPPQSRSANSNYSDRHQPSQSVLDTNPDFQVPSSKKAHRPRNKPSGPPSGPGPAQANPKDKRKSQPAAFSLNDGPYNISRQMGN